MYSATDFVDRDAKAWIFWNAEVAVFSKNVYLAILGSPGTGLVSQMFLPKVQFFQIGDAYSLRRNWTSRRTSTIGI